MMESVLFERYGMPVDLVRDRPLEEFEAHVAIARGRNKAEEEESKEAERKMNSAS